MPDKMPKGPPDPEPAPSVETTEFVVEPKVTVEPRGRQYTLVTAEGSARVQVTIDMPTTAHSMPHSGDLLRVAEEFLLKVECTLKTTATNNKKSRGGR